MKRKTYIIIAIVTVAVVAAVAYVLRPLSPSKTENFSDGDLKISVSYSRPYKKGRLIFGEGKDAALVPYGKYWRLGANASTEITFTKDVTFAGNSVSAGTYRMYAVPGNTSWQIMLNTELGKSGTETPNDEKDVVKAEVPVTGAPSETEQFSIVFAKDGSTINMSIVWDQTAVVVPITH